MIRKFTFMLFFLSSLAIMADDVNTTLVFVNEQGEEIANGSVIDVKEAEIDDFGTIQLPSGLYVKNTTSSSVYTSMAYTISQIDNGTFQICFPSYCITKDVAGVFETTQGTLAGNKTVSAQCEWFPSQEGAYGTVVAKLQIILYKYNAVTKQYSKNGYGPTVTVNFNYTDADDVKSINAEDSNDVAYNLAGQAVDENTYKGIVVKNGKKYLKKH